MNQPVSYRWHPIEDLPDDYPTLVSAELAALSRVWEEQRHRLRDANALRVFQEKMHRQWAIETGIIERLYSLDRGVTETLIEHGIDSSRIPHGATDEDPRLVVRVIHDHEEAIEWIFSFVKGERRLSVGFIKNLHALMTRHQETTAAVDQFGRGIEVPLLRGAFKTLSNNPVREDGSVHEYCPPEQVNSEMDRLVALHHEHTAMGVAPEVEAAWLHHRFTQIHPFQDGNGRVVRALASLVLICAGWFPLVVTRDDRERYIQALESADRSDLGSMVSLVGALQTRAFVQALGIADTAVQDAARIEQVIRSIRDEFSAKEQPPGQDKVRETAALVLADAGERMRDVAERLSEQLGEIFPSARFFAHCAGFDDARRDWHRWQLVQVAQQLDYFANTRDYAAWCRLVLETESQAEVLLSLHSVGREWRGIIVASLAFFRREEDEDEQRQVTDPIPVVDEIFQMNYREDEQSVRERFGGWLESGLVRALQMWRQGL